MKVKDLINTAEDKRCAHCLIFIGEPHVTTYSPYYGVIGKIPEEFREREVYRWSFSANGNLFIYLKDEE